MDFRQLESNIKSELKKRGLKKGDLLNKMGITESGWRNKFDKKTLRVTDIENISEFFNGETPFLKDIPGRQLNEPRAEYRSNDELHQIRQYMMKISLDQSKILDILRKCE